MVLCQLSLFIQETTVSIGTGCRSSKSIYYKLNQPKKRVHYDNTLHELSDKILTALDIFSEMDECSEAEKAEAQVIIGQLTESFNDKAVSVAMFIRNIEVEAEAIAEAKKSMDAREKALKAKANRLKTTY